MDSAADELVPAQGATPARVAGAVLLAAAACTLGALILGEYQFTGTMPYLAGVLFGLVVGELAAEVSRSRSRLLAVGVGAMVAGGLAWAAYISTGEGLRPFPEVAWWAMLLGFLAAALRIGNWRRTS